MKDLLVSTRPSYQRLLMKLSRARMRRSTFLFFLLKAKSEASLAFSCPLPATPQSGSSDQNKLKKALWTLSVFNLSPILILTLYFSLSLTPTLSLSCCFSPKSVYRTKKIKKIITDTHTSYLPFTPLFCVFISCCLPSSSPCFTFSPWLFLFFFFFGSLIFPGCECALPDCPRCLSHRGSVL